MDSYKDKLDAILLKTIMENPIDWENPVSINRLEGQLLGEISVHQMKSGIEDDLRNKVKIEFRREDGYVYFRDDSLGFYAGFELKMETPTRIKIFGICGSPRKPEESITFRAMQSYIQEKFKENRDEYISMVPMNLSGCIDCKNPYTSERFKENWDRKIAVGERQCSLREHREYLETVVREIIKADVVVIGSPVYLDHPTPQLMALLTRLTCWAESTNRIHLKDKPCHIIATGFCSGTKTTIGALFNMVEMLGFTIPGRSSREYILKWDDTKLRGGLKGEEIYL